MTLMTPGKAGKRRMLELKRGKARMFGLKRGKRRMLESKRNKRQIFKMNRRKRAVFILIYERRRKPSTVKKNARWCNRAPLASAFLAVSGKRRGCRPLALLALSRSSKDGESGRWLQHSFFASPCYDVKRRPAVKRVIGAVVGVRARCDYRRSPVFENPIRGDVDAGSPALSPYRRWDRFTPGVTARSLGGLTPNRIRGGGYFVGSGSSEVMPGRPRIAVINFRQNRLHRKSIVLDDRGGSTRLKAQRGEARRGGFEMPDAFAKAS